MINQCLHVLDQTCQSTVNSFASLENYVFFVETLSDTAAESRRCVGGPLIGPWQQSAQTKHSHALPAQKGPKNPPQFSFLVWMCQVRGDERRYCWDPFDNSPFDSPRCAIYVGIWISSGKRNCLWISFHRALQRFSGMFSIHGHCSKIACVPRVSSGPLL